MGPATCDIPVIDLAPFLAGGPGAGSVVDAVRTACEEIGFFCVTAHGVPDEIVDALGERARAFFDLPDEAKRRVGQSGDQLGGVTFSPLASEALAASRGERTPGDLKQMLGLRPRVARRRLAGRARRPARGARAVLRRAQRALGAPAAHLRARGRPAAGRLRERVRQPPLVAARDRLSRARRRARAGPAAGRGALGLRVPHDPALPGLGRRPAGAVARRPLDRRAGDRRRVRGQPRRRADAHDERPLGVDAPPRRESARRRVQHAPPVDPVLPQPRSRGARALPRAVRRRRSPGALRADHATATTRCR